MTRPRMSRRLLKPGLLAASAVLVVGAGAGAAIESDTVGSFGRGLWWAISLMTTVGFVGPPPRTTAGAIVSVVLMLTGFLMLSLLSAALASLFVREDVKPVEKRELVAEQEISQQLEVIAARLAGVEAQLAILADPSTRADVPENSTPEPDVGP